VQGFEQRDSFFYEHYVFKLENYGKHLNVEFNCTFNFKSSAEHRQISYVHQVQDLSAKPG